MGIPLRNPADEPAYSKMKPSSTESFNGKLRDALLNGEIFEKLLETQVLIERWRIGYNTVRPHSSLGYRPPAPDRNGTSRWYCSREQVIKTTPIHQNCEIPKSYVENTCLLVCCYRLGALASFKTLEY